MSCVLARIITLFTEIWLQCRNFLRKSYDRFTSDLKHVLGDNNVRLLLKQCIVNMDICASILHLRINNV